ncbi:MAG: DEAD/DEAH box helicase [Bryobacteraceae bacterium]
MRILHAAWRDGALWLWAETSEGFAAPGAKKESRKTTIRLPAVKGRPVPSCPLLADTPEGEPALEDFVVPAAPLGPARMLELLADCRDKQVLEPGVLVGADLAYWTNAMRFAGALVAREQFLPGVDAEGRPRWRAVYLGADAARCEKLAAAMPAAARAMLDGVPARRVLGEFVDTAADQLVRAAAPFHHPCLDSPHDRWLAGLTAADPQPVQELATAVREWQAPALADAEAPFRLAFRLEEPGEDNRAWNVGYFLQGSRDPSLLVPAAQVWSAKRNRVLNVAGFNPREHLLRGLGQASGIDPHIEASLKDAAPHGYATDAAGAFQFLTGASGALEQAGFTVLLPSWWTRRGTKQRLSARASVKSSFTGSGGLSMSGLVQFEWQIALGGEPLTAAELKALADLKQPLVKVRGQWVQVTADDIRAAAEFWNKRSGQMTVRQAVRIAIGAEDQAGGLPVDGIAAEGWMAELLDQLNGSAAFEQLPPPAGLNATLRPYQARGYAWLAFLRRCGLGACLADDMGLGKTIQALSLLERDRELDGKRPVLLVCPTSVVGNWQKEAERFTPGLSVMVHHGATRARGETFRSKAAGHAMVISSYALLARDFEALKRVDWRGVILDEAQNIKNPETRQATAARGLKCDFRIALTGTPVENNVGDLWSIMEFLNPGFLGSRAEFRKRFFLPIQSGADPEAPARLKRLTRPFILRRLKTDRDIINDLPEKLEMRVFCNLTKEQASLYAAVVKDAEEAIESADGIQRKGVVLATLSKLKQVCNHPAQFLGDASAIPGRSGKLARLTEMVEELLAAGDRALIFSQFAEMGEILRRHLQESFGRETLFLHGGTPKKQRDRMVARFQSGDGPPLFVLSLKAGGTGLNLTAANHVFHFDRWWNPAVENQATDRAFRIGQTKNVQVHKFLCVGTLEERIDEMIERKKSIASGVIGAGEAWLTELSNAELRDLFALRKEAVAE